MAFSIVIKDKTFSSLEQIGKEMYLYPEAFEKILTSRKFLLILKQEDEEKFHKLIEYNHLYRDVNAFLFYAQYLFCPHMELKYHRHKFDSLKQLGEYIIYNGPSIDIYTKDLLKLNLLSKYMKDQGLDKKNPKIYDEVKDLERLSIENENRAYFLLGFRLSECDKIIYDKKEYDSVKDFFKTMTSDYYLYKFSSGLEIDQYVYAWLIVKGYEDVIVKYRGLIDTIEEMEK